MTKRLHTMIKEVVILFTLLHLSRGTINCSECDKGSGDKLVCPNYLNGQYEIRLNNLPGTNDPNLFLLGSNKKTLNLDLLNDCSFPLIRSFALKLAPFPSSFKDLLSNIGINPSRINILKCEHTNTDFVHLNKRHFDGLGNLTSIILSYTSLLSIAEDTFSSNARLKSVNIAGNKLNSELQPKTFASLPELKVLYLNDNNITVLHENLFENLTKLEKLRLSGNPIEILPEKLISNLIELREFSLSFTRIKILHSNSFLNNKNLYKISLNNNLLEAVPGNLFRENGLLEEIYLNNNKISSLPEKIFDYQPSLRKLNLSNNKLDKITENIFFKTPNITDLWLNHNLFTVLPPNLFDKLIHLEILHLNNNLLQKCPSFSKCSMLKELYLQRNNLSRLSQEDFRVRTNGQKSLLSVVDLSYNNLDQYNTFLNFAFALNHQTNLKAINLSNNNFTASPFYGTAFSMFTLLQTIDLSNNLIISLDLRSISGLADGVNVNLKYNNISRVIYNPNFYINVGGSKKTFSFSLEGNRFDCNCDLLSFAKLLSLSEPDSANPVTIRILDVDELLCGKPEQFSNRSVSQLRPEDFVCRVPDNHCSQSCPCIYRMSDKMFILECDSQKLAHLPIFSRSVKSRNFTLDLRNNNISSFVNLTDNVVNLTLTKNSVSVRTLMELKRLPRRLNYLDLSENNLEYLPDNFIKLLEKKQITLKLERNPWTCECTSDTFLQFLQASFSKVQNINEITCQNFNGSALISLTKEDLCPSNVIVPLAVGCALVIVIAVSATIFYYRHKTAIKIWLFNRNLCAWLTYEEELDSDKKYDAFISYAQQEDNFVMETLVKGLEEGEPKYRICVHHRDWIPGQTIQEQIVSTVNDSRRTIVVLSNNFLNSSWGQREFREAHQQALEDNTNRVIVIVYGELPAEENMDADLKNYIKLHTYLKWDNPKFWDQLRYAMPHRKISKKKSKRNIYTDKMELVNGHSKQSLQQV